MKKWIVYVLGIITGIILTFVVAICANLSDSGIAGLEIFDDSDEYLESYEFQVFQVVEGGCALAMANTDNPLGMAVLILPNEDQQFYDNQGIVLRDNQRALRIGTYKYYTKTEMEKTIPAVRIVDVDEMPKSNNSNTGESNSGKNLFDRPGDCVSRKNFKVQEVLESGDAIALEVDEIIAGHEFTSDLEVLILADDGSHFYNNQIVKAPNGKSARQIGTYRYQKYGKPTVIPIIAFK